MIFDIKDSYSSVSRKTISDSINFARQHVQIKIEDFSTTYHARKLILCYKECRKENTNLFDVAMGAYHEAETCATAVYMLTTDLPY